MEGAKTFRDDDHKCVKDDPGNLHSLFELSGRRREQGEIVLPSSSDFKDAEYFKNRAEEARALAYEMQDAHTKSLMLGIARSYEEIAKSFAKIANWQDRSGESK